MADLSKDLPFRITRKMPLNYGEIQACNLPDATFDEGYEAFRIASFGEAPDPAEEKYSEGKSSCPGTISDESDSAVEDKLTLHNDPTYHDPHLPLGKIFIGGAIVIGLLAGSSYINTKPRQSSNSQHSAAQNVRVDLDLKTFNMYQSRIEEKYAEFSRSRHVNMKPISVPEGLPPLDDGLGAGAFAFDMEGDGTEEIYLQSGCGSGGCFGFVYQDSGSGWVKILDTPIDRISDRIVNGKPVIFDARKHYLPGGGFTDMIMEHSWDGQRLAESDKFIMPEFLPSIADNIRLSFNELNPQKTSEHLRALEQSIGAYYALRAFLQFREPPGFTMPTGSEYVEYVRQWAIEVERTNPGMGARALTRYANDPSGFFAAVYGRSLEPAFLDVSNPRSIVVASLSMALRRHGKSGDWERHMMYWDRAQGGIGFLAAYRNAIGKYPQSESELWNAMNNVVREEKLRTTGSAPSYRPEQPGGTQTYQSGPIVGDPRHQTWEAQPQRPADQDMSRQMDRTSREAMERGRQMGNQGLERGRQMMNQLFKQPEKKQ